VILKVTVVKTNFKHKYSMIPLILGAAALATSAFGVTKGAEGVGNMNQAKEIGNRAQKLHEDAICELKTSWQTVNKAADLYGQIQLRITQSTVMRFVAFIEKIGQQTSRKDMNFLSGLDISPLQIQEYKAIGINPEDCIKGGVSAAVAGAAAYSGATTLARTVGTASVANFFGLWTAEVGISQLGGAAARGATLTWLGGSSAAVGGVVLGGITLGPALMIGGFKLAGKGEEALTKAREYEAQVITEIANLEASQDFLIQVKRRIVEVSQLVCNVNTRADLALKELEALESFDKDLHTEKFQKAALLIKALTEIMKVPVLDSQGQLNINSISIQAKYSPLI
jgi:hypothetical protein